jgi:polysaccharide chain length determinant protein (PEP-CTERM system associated)
VTELFQLFFHYLNGLWKRRWWVVLIAWVVAIPGWLVVASMPSVYQSSSRIYVDTASVLQPLLRGLAVQSDLGAQVQLMRQTLTSRPNLMEVARKTDYDLTVTSDAQMEGMLNSLASRTTVQANREDIFSISFEDTDPQRARDVVQALLTIFVEGNLGQSRQDLNTAEDFIDRQIADYEQRLEEAENRLARFKQENIDVALGGGSYLERATAATKRMELLEQDLAVAVAQRNLLQQELSGTPDFVPSANVTSGPPDDTSMRIVNLEFRLRELQAQYTEKHPDVVTTQRQLESLYAKQEATLAALAEEGESGAGPGGMVEAGGVPNPVYSEIKLRLLEIDTQIENLRRRAATARAEAEALEAKAGSVPEIEAEFQRLNRDYDIVKGRHDELLARRESARMSRSREAVGQEVQYRLIEPPVVPSRPSGPNRGLYLSAVLVFSLAAGAGFAFLLVLLDTSFNSVAELSSFTGLPVLGSVSDTRRKTASRVTGLVGLAAGLAGLFVVYGALVMIERQYGLDTVVAANAGAKMFDGGVSGLVERVSAFLN